MYTHLDMVAGFDCVIIRSRLIKVKTQYVDILLLLEKHCFLYLNCFTFLCGSMVISHVFQFSTDDTSNS